MEKTIEDYIELYKNNGYINEMRKYVGHAPIMSCACGVIIENAKGEILLQKRRDNGCWAIIGGAMEMGETFEETIRRESKEESGLTLGKLEIFKLYSGKDRIIEYPNGDICFGPGIVFITKDYNGEIINQPEEVLEHRFFKKSELPENLNKYDKDIILEWAAKTANLYARIEPETKGPAEAILAALGIPVSTAINMFYKQIILNNGLPFKAQLPSNKPLNLSEMTEDQFNLEMEKAYQSIQRGEGIPIEEAFEKIKKQK